MVQIQPSRQKNLKKSKKNVDLYTVLFVLYSVMRKGKNMNLKGKKMSVKNYIEIESVGSLAQEDGLVFPIDCSEAPETASDAEEMMGVHILDTDEEWWMSLSKDEAFRVLEFVEETGVIDMGFFPEGENTKWASNMYHIAGTYDELSMEMS